MAITAARLRTEVVAETSGAERNLSHYGKTVDDVAKNAEKAAKKHAEQNRAMEEVGRGAMIAGGALLAGFGVAVKATMDFDKQLSELGAVSNATGKQMDAFREQALKAGKDTAFSASEAAQAQVELAKAGVSTADIMGGALSGALSLAAAGQLDLGQAAEISAQAMNIFGLRGKDVTHIADLLAAGANKSAADVTQLGDALKQGGLVAAQTGLSIEETVGALSAFADNALIGSDAGTSFKTMLQRLTPVSAEARNLMSDLGFSAYDAQGNFIGLEGLAGELQTSLGGMTVEQRNAAMAVLFGSDAVRAANILYSEGAEGISEYVAAVDDQGAAAEMAAAKLDNLAGDLEELKGSVETALIQSGSQANDVLRGLTQTVTGTVNGFLAMPESVQAGGMAVAGVGGAALVTMGAIGNLIPKVREVRESLASLGPAGASANTALGFMGRALPGVAIGFTLLVNAMGKAQAQADELVATLTSDVDLTSADSMREAIRGIDTELATLDAQWSDWGKGWIFDDVGRGARALVEILPGVEDSVMKNVAATNALRDAMEGLQGQQIHLSENTWELRNRLGLTEKQVIQLADKAGVDLTNAFGDVVPVLMEAYLQLQSGSAILDTNAVAVEGLTEAEVELTDVQKRLTEAVEGFFDPLSVYTTLLQDKETQERTNAEALAAHTESQEDSWEDYVGDVGVSIDEYVRRLEEQVLAQVQWEQNLLTIAQRGHVGVAQELAAMGVEGAQLVAQFVNASDTEMTRMQNVLNTRSSEGVKNVVGNIDFGMKIAAAVAASGGKATADAIATELGIGADKVREIANRYGIDLAAGVNPVLSGIGRPVVRVYPGQNNMPLAAGGLVDFLASGGVKEKHLAQIARAGDWRVWAEPETGGEAYIPLANDWRRGRAIDVWEETGRRLGAWRDTHYAAGGFYDPGSVPRPPSTDPEYGNIVGYSGEQAMEHLFAAVAAFVAQNGLGGDLVQVGRQLQARGFRVGEHPAFGGVSAVHTPGSYHYRGRAIDINYGPAGRSAIETAAINAIWPQLRSLPGVAEALWQTKGHFDHAHLAMRKGGILNPWVRDFGGPLMPGFTYNGTGRSESVVPGGRAAKHYQLTVQTVQSDADVMEQFRRMELLGA